MQTKIKPCKFCFQTTHYSFQCRLNPKNQNSTILVRKPLPRPMKRIKLIGKKGKANQATTEAWRAQNKEFICYLQISPQCLINLDEQTAVPEHVIPKSRGQKYAHDLKNIRASCTFCNQLKGSRVLT